MKVEMNSDQGRYIDEVSKNNIKRTEIKEEKVDTKEAPKTQEQTENENKRVREIVGEINKELEKIDTSLEFRVHENSNGMGLNRVSIKVVEKDSEKVIAEIPSEESIKIAEKMEEITGILFDHSR